MDAGAFGQLQQRGWLLVERALMAMIFLFKIGFSNNNSSSVTFCPSSSSTVLRHTFFFRLHFLRRK